MNWKISFEDRARKDGFGHQLSVGRGSAHPKKIVREFLRSHSDASHLFFAKQIMPKLDSIDFEIDYNITSLIQRLCEDDEEVQHEDF